MKISLAEALARIDVRAFYEMHKAVPAGKPTRSREGFEQACSCPLCGGTDRASYWLPTGRFFCLRGCRQAKASNPYWYARDILKMTHSQALRELGIDPSEIDSYSQSTSKVPLFLLKDEVPCQKWQEAASTFIHLAEKCLWSSKGKSALKYLHSRGFKDETIRAARLGLCPDWYEAPLESWGLDPAQLMKTDDPRILIPKGITIPWRDVSGNLWKVQLRRPEPGPDGKMYKEVLGSSSCLYSIQAIEADRPLLMVESELDALSVYQEAGDLVTCVATGSAAKGNQYIGQVLRASLILQSFDNDEAGSNGAAEWLKRLPEKKVRRWAPWAHDCNDMLKTGLPIRVWLENGLQAATSIESAPPEQISEQGEEPQKQSPLSGVPPALSIRRESPHTISDPGLCFTCGQPSFTITDANEGYCKACWKAQGHMPPVGEGCCMCGDFIDAVGPDDRFYCADCLAKVEQNDQGDAFVARVREILDGEVRGAPVWPGQRTIRLLPKGMSTGEYIEQWYQGERPGQLIEGNDDQSKNAPARKISLEERLCPHCKAAGRRSVGGVELVKRGQTPWANTYKKTPGGPYSYIWNDARQFWVCPGCQDIQLSMSVDVSYKHTFDENQQFPVGALADSALELKAKRIAEVEKLPLAQARYWARIRSHLKAGGYYDQVEQGQMKLQARIAEYRAKWFSKAS